MNIFSLRSKEDVYVFDQWSNDLSSGIEARNIYIANLKKDPSHLETLANETILLVGKQIADAKEAHQHIEASVKLLAAEDFVIARLFRTVIAFLFGYETAYAKECRIVSELETQNQSSLKTLETFSNLLKLPVILEVFDNWLQLSEAPHKETYNLMTPMLQIRNLKKELRGLNIAGESKFSREIQQAEELFGHIRKKFFTQQDVHVENPPVSDLIGPMQRPKGIRNQGNTCYLASLLQVLRAIPHFRNYIDNEEVLGVLYDPTTDHIQDVNPLKQAIREFLANMDASPVDEPLSGVHEAIRTKLFELNLIDRLHGQCDSSELLIKIMDLMGYKFQTKMFCKSTLSDVHDIAQLGNDPSFREEIEYDRQEYPLFSLPIQIGASLENIESDLSKVFFEKGFVTEANTAFYEIVDGERKPKAAIRRQEYSFADVLPEVIPVVRKRTDELDVPFGSVPLRFHPAGEDRESYVLMATIHHEGNALGGHYYAYVRKDEQTFYCCDDSNISEVNLDENKNVLNGELIYFYVKEPRN